MSKDIKSAGSSTCVVCWNCKAENPNSPSFFCMSCHKIQQPARLTNAFQFMGLPPQFNIDLQELESQYLTLSQQLHPDQFSQKTAREKLFATQQTTQLNKAYSILQDPVKRGHHLMSLAGYGDGGNKNTINDPDVLTEIMEFRETLDKADTPEKIATLMNAAMTSLNATYQIIEDALSDHQYDMAHTSLYRYRYYKKIFDDAQKRYHQQK